ncbi:MAG: S9 family peptidase [Tannerella sp.]|jgi:dipeptidyl aminopeptidase/acylaminoacyl peptidase|nr:S9 family peptidase [Tannerella sp.]
MKKSNRFVSALYVVFTASLMMTSLGAQEKTLTLQDLIPGGRNQFRFVPRNLKQLQWCGEQYIYVKGDSLLAALPADKSEQVALTLEQLNRMLETAGYPSIGSMPDFSVPFPKQPGVLAFQYRNFRIHFDRKALAVTAAYTLEPQWENFEFCEANGCLAFTEKNNVRILSPENRASTVTDETEDGIVCGASVHQHEFGIRKGLFWSPQGAALAFYRMDERMVADYPLVNIHARVAKAEPFKYPMAGMKSHEVTVGVYHLSGGRTVWLKTGLPKEKYLTNIVWTPDEKSICIAELNREQNECRLVRYSAQTGEREAELFTERNEKYVEPQHPALFLPNDPTRFVWQSQRDGYNHLYLYDIHGKLLKQLTSGKWVVTEVLGFDEKGANLYFSATAPRTDGATGEGNPLENYTWQLNLKTGVRTCINAKSGVHRVTLSPSGLYAIDRTVSPVTPHDIDVLRLKDRRTVKSLLSAPDPFREYGMPDVATGTLTAADGQTTLYYRLTTPPRLDRTKKYPVIVYVYGGPHARMVTGGWMNGVGGWDIYMALRGYVMFTIDGRGSADRGFAFESAIHRQLGVCEMEDQLKGVEWLKSQPFVDGDRIGVHGWSYGGFMTTNLMLTRPDVFRAGVAGGPVIDWSHYEIMYGERYMDHPKENPEGYANADLREKAGNLKGRLLLIHGAIDPVVVWQHSLLFLDACIQAGTFPDYFVYPRHKHNVTGKDRPHLYEMITRYFDEHL